VDWANILWFELNINLPIEEAVLRKTSSEPYLLGGAMIKSKELPAFMPSSSRSVHRRIFEAKFSKFFYRGSCDEIFWKITCKG